MVVVEIALWWIGGAVVGLFIAALRADQRAARRLREARRRAAAPTPHEH